MTSKLTKQQRAKVVQERFDSLDWQLSMTAEQMDDLYRTLPKRLENEHVMDWLRRIRRTYGRRLSDVSQIVRRAAADNRLTDAILYTPDESLRLTIRQLEQGIHVKVDALGLALDRYANRTIGISSAQALNRFIAVIALDASGQGQRLFPESDDIRDMMLDPRVNLIIGIVE
jgi:hypothetical protein